jgi:anti-sigma regulatory factor (Ser/Thr protein kinase)
MANTDPPGSTTVVLEQAFHADTLFSLRSAVAAHGAELGLTGFELGDLVLVAHELAANAVRHGGATEAVPGRLRLWQTPAGVVCEVSDQGPGLHDPAVGVAAVSAAATNGRGLWIARQVARDVTIDTGPDGTVVTVTLDPDQKLDP